VDALSDIQTSPSPWLIDGDMDTDVTAVLRDNSDLPEHPPRSALWRPKLSIVRATKSLWADRELIRTLAERDLKTRYSQSVLGILWSLITPVITVLMFTLFFKKIGHLQTPGIPYPLLAFTGLIPWNFFTSGFSSGYSALGSNSNLMSKIACPREVFIFSSISTSLFDMVLACVPLGVMFLIFGQAPSSTAYWIVPLFILQLMFMFGMSFMFSVLTIYLRDLRLVIGGFLSAGLYLSPVAYPVQNVLQRLPPPIRKVYPWINPFVGLLDSYRRALLEGMGPDWSIMGPGAVTCVVALLIGYLVFRRLEPGVADIA
jgi:ABC-2 type transport system permease protein/lipopolysaccharide transport system permease protein